MQELSGRKRKAVITHPPDSPTFEIRARPLDCEKRLPLVFTAEEERRVEPGDDSLAGEAPLDPPTRGMSAGASPLAAFFIGCGASSSSGLYRTYSRDSFSHAGVDDEITVPLFGVLAEWEAFPRQFTRPQELIKGRPPSEEELVEYEMDLDDEKWLADWNLRNPASVIEIDAFELYLDRLEKARASPTLGTGRGLGGGGDSAPRIARARARTHTAHSTSCCHTCPPPLRLSRRAKGPYARAHACAPAHLTNIDAPIHTPPFSHCSLLVPSIHVPSRRAGFIPRAARTQSCRACGACRAPIDSICVAPLCRRA